MSGQLYVVSNRVPSDGPPSGGLVVALDDCLRARGGTWIGTSGQISDTPASHLRDVDNADYAIKVFDLTEEEQRDYYLGYANSVLWPLCHRRTDLMALSQSYFDGYMGVNDRLADMLAAMLGPDDLIWVHDYHFLPLAACLRARGVTARIGYFHHIPFPAPTDLMALPERDTFYEWISSFDLVGLQTQADVATALDLFRRHPKAEQRLNGRVAFAGREVSIQSFPIGIDAETFLGDAQDTDGRALLNMAPNERLIIGVDRLDYSKGLNQRLTGFGTYLDRIHGTPERVRLLQVAPPTREDVQAYREVRKEMEHTAGRLNGLYSELGSTPIQYIHRPLARKTLAALYRAADVSMVTPLADGMNLVAKEFVAAQDPDDPGVLILSRFAGAAEQLRDALIVNPHDTHEMADAIATALAMPLAERRNRYEAMRGTVFGDNIARWTDDYLASLRAAGHGAADDLLRQLQ